MKLTPTLTLNRKLALPTIADIAISGRFGNQCILYVMAKRVGEICGATVLCPPWEGSELFIIQYSEIPDCHRRIVGAPPLWWEGVISIANYFTCPQDLLDRLVNATTARRFLRIRPDVKLPEADQTVIHYRGFRDEWMCVDRPTFTVKDVLSAVEASGASLKKAVVLTDVVPGARFQDDFLRMVAARNLYVYPTSSFSIMAGFLNNNTVWMPEDQDDFTSPLKFTAHKWT